MAALIPVRKNFLPLLAVPIIVPVLVSGGALVVGYTLYKNAEGELSAVISAPAVLGGVAGFVVGYQLKSDTAMKVAYSAIGYTVGMLVHNYVLAPAETKIEQAQAKAACESSSWLTPWKWCW
jgi:hypothetical protein